MSCASQDWESGSCKMPQTARAPVVEENFSTGIPTVGTCNAWPKQLRKAAQAGCWPFHPSSTRT